MTSTSPLKALIVDDEFAGRMMIANLLKEVLPVVSFHFASSSEEVMLMIKQHRYDMFFLDVNLPGKTGLEIASDLHVLDYVSYIILVSAYERFDWSREALRLGLFDYLIKPIVKEEFDELMVRLMQHLSERANIRIKELSFGKPEEIKVSLRITNGILSLRASEIVCFEADGSYCVMTSFDEQRAITIFESLCDIELRVKDYGLMRLGRKHIINPMLVERLNSKDHTCLLRIQSGYKTIVLSVPAYNQLVALLKVKTI